MVFAPFEVSSHDSTSAGRYATIVSAKEEAAPPATSMPDRGEPGPGPAAAAGRRLALGYVPDPGKLEVSGIVNTYIEAMRELVGSRRIFVPGVRVLIVNDAGEVLLQRRTDLRQWGLPAGAAELDESAADAVTREVMEETSLRVLEIEPMALYSGPDQQFKYPNGDEVQCFALAVIVRRWEGQPRPDGAEGSEVRFFPLSQLPADLVPIHRRTLDDYRHYAGRFLLR
jgi:ADP-ribose pyrophosphatase YjhB (NUDIX family)